MALGRVEELRAAVRDVPDCPKRGIVFKDIPPVLSDPVLFRASIDLFLERCRGLKIDKIVGIDARGFLFGSAVAYELGLGFVPIRKRGKLPYRTETAKESLEYGEAGMEMNVFPMRTSGHLEKVLAHAESRLAATGTRRPTEVLPLYKKFLKVEEHRLRLKHQAGGGGREICGRRAELVDILLRYVFGAAAATVRGNGETKVPVALIALGGYGRGELNPFSDVDVMVLHHHGVAEISPHLQEMANQVLYLLWDSGFKVGHSTRSIKEAITEANRDMRTKTAMLESRFLAGDSELAQEFRKQFRSKCVDGHEQEYVAMRMQDQVSRHKKYGDSVYLQEPNLKSGCGGLRDYQNLLWMTYFKEGSLSTNQLVGKDWLSEIDQRRIR